MINRIEDLLRNESTVAAQHAVLMSTAAAGTYLMTSNGDWSGQLVDSGLAASKADDRVSRELARAYLKRPGRGVPPPRSGPPPFVVMCSARKCHAIFDKRPAGMPVQPPVHVYENSYPAWGPP